MDDQATFLIVDGDPEETRLEYLEADLKPSYELMRELLVEHVPDALCDVWRAADAPGDAPTDDSLAGYAGVLWARSDLAIDDRADARVSSQIDVAQRCFETGTPQFGSSWGLLVACVAAGGEVSAHPDGWELGVVRKIALTDAGRTHAMMTGRPPAFDHLAYHGHEVTKLPDGALALAGSPWSDTAALAIQHEGGVFWATQYLPEYDLGDMARLLRALSDTLVDGGLFRTEDDLSAHADRLEALSANPGRIDLRWQLGLDEDVLDEGFRHLEFTNWLQTCVAGAALM